MAISFSDDVFMREIQIDSCKNSLKIVQKLVGDVSCVVWDAAIVLANFLEVENERCEKKWIPSKKILELGAGLGCVGLFAACLGGDVVMTDLPEVMPLLQMNIDGNKALWTEQRGRAIAKVLKWGPMVGDLDIPSILLVADCVYYDQSAEPLIETICALTDEDTDVIISQEDREQEKLQKLWQYFLSLLCQKFDVTWVPVELQHPHFSSPDIILLRARKKLHPM
uniref:Methyltransferase-like protein 21D n=1 Tax=Timema douglasi TaxID=61478 RepID=A0A7R8VDV0_TIMDO|nr:unnamed protein product [Timema douglasi]